MEPVVGTVYWYVPIIKYDGLTVRAWPVKVVSPVQSSGQHHYCSVDWLYDDGSVELYNQELCMETVRWPGYAHEVECNTVFATKEEAEQEIKLREMRELLGG